MTAIVLAVRTGYWRRPLALLRKALAAVRERRAEFARCAVLAEAYRHTPVECRVRGAYPSHRAPRVRRQRAARAPRGARHTVAPGRRHVELPSGWRRAVHAGRAVASHRAAWARSSVAEILAGV